MTGAIMEPSKEEKPARSHAKMGREGEGGADAVTPLDITVLAGGPGVEREVSLLSGQAVYEALMGLGHRVGLCDISPDDLSALDRDVDVVFVALHGEFGEDGVVQAEMESRGLRYTGSDSAASRLAMDKVAAKRCFQQAGIATPSFEVVDRDGVDSFTFPIPAVVKPVASGSSVDTYIATTPRELAAAVAVVCAKHGQALVEAYIDGPELTVSVLGDQALCVCEIRTGRPFYDYQAKYIDDDTEYLLDVDLPNDLLRRVQSLSLAAHRALGCRTFSRADFMVDGQTLEPYILEVNTIPGFTSHSLFPKAAQRAGMNFAQFCQRVVTLTMAEGEEG